jgi:Domain of unknown function (DUF5591)
MRQATIEFQSLRADWYANGNFMARALQRQLRAKKPLVKFVGFPTHWLPLFEWAQAPWRSSTEPQTYVPLISGRTETEILFDIAKARRAGQLRLLVEVVASAETVLCETLQRVDGRLSISDFDSVPDNAVRLTTWHSYNRADVRAFDSLVAGFRQSKSGVLFMPCAKARPYQNSQAHRRLMRMARDAGINTDGFDKIVITSIGPVPEGCWDLDFVQRYDTGVRDIYRLFLQTKALLSGTNYLEAWDLMSFAPYSDMLRLLNRDGVLPEPKRLPSIRRRNIPIYRPLAQAAT